VWIAEKKGRWDASQDNIAQKERRLVVPGVKSVAG